MVAVVEVALAVGVAELVAELVAGLLEVVELLVLELAELLDVSAVLSLDAELELLVVAAVAASEADSSVALRDVG